MSFSFIMFHHNNNYQDNQQFAKLLSFGILSSPFFSHSFVMLRTTTQVPQYRWNAKETPGTVTASMRPCVQCIGIAAPNGQPQNWKFHVAGVTPCLA